MMLVAGICLAILMAGAVKVHVDLQESPVPAVVPLLLAIFVAGAQDAARCADEPLSGARGPAGARHPLTLRRDGATLDVTLALARYL